MILSAAEWAIIQIDCVIIDDSHEFPSEENLATQEGFGQAQMYELRDIVKEASKALRS